MAHREGIRDYLKEVKLHGTVHDWGCGAKPIKNYLKADATFVGIDKNSNVNPDVVGDVEQPLIVPGGQADFAFCLEVLEHVWKPTVMLVNIRNNLKPKGTLYLSQPFLYRVHKEDDRVRYTHHGLKQLLETLQFIVEDIQPTVGTLDEAEGYIVRARK